MGDPALIKSFSASENFATSDIASRITPPSERQKAVASSLGIERRDISGSENPWVELHPSTRTGHVDEDATQGEQRKN